MTGVLAHQGGWDEILLPTLAVLGLLWFIRIRRRRAEGPTASPASDDAGEVTPRCGYCDAPLPEGARRCGSCGFRVTPG